MTTNDYVAYHSTEVMRCKYKPRQGAFRFFSRKTRTYLGKSIGSTAWVITGTRNADRKLIYHLAAVYTPDVLEQEGEGFAILGTQGYCFRKPVELNSLPWFATLLHEQNKFSFGFSRIQDPGIIAALNGLRDEDQKGKTKPESI